VHDVLVSPVWASARHETERLELVEVTRHLARIDADLPCDLQLARSWLLREDDERG